LTVVAITAASGGLLALALAYWTSRSAPDSAEKLAGQVMDHLKEVIAKAPPQGDSTDLSVRKGGGAAEYAAAWTGMLRDVARPRVAVTALFASVCLFALSAAITILERLYA